MCRTSSAVGACSARTVLPLYVSNALGGKINSLRPIDLSPAVVMTFLGWVSPLTDQWLTKPIRVGVNVLEPRGFGADITFAQDIVFVTANRDDVFTIVLNFDTTHGLAEMAGAIVKL